MTRAPGRWMSLSTNDEPISDSQLLAIARQRDVNLFRPLAQFERFLPLLVLLWVIPPWLSLNGRIVALDAADAVLARYALLTDQQFSTPAVPIENLPPTLNGPASAWIAVLPMFAVVEVTSRLAFLPSFGGGILTLFFLTVLARQCFGTCAAFFTALLATGSIAILGCFQQLIPVSLGYAAALAGLCVWQRFLTSSRSLLPAIGAGVLLGLAFLISIPAGLFAAAVTMLSTCFRALIGDGSRPARTLTAQSTGGRRRSRSTIVLGGISTLAVGIGIAGFGFGSIPTPRPTVPTASDITPPVDVDTMAQVRKKAAAFDAPPQSWLILPRQFAWLSGFLVAAVFGIIRQSIWNRRLSQEDQFLMAVVLAGAAMFFADLALASDWVLQIPPTIAAILLIARGIDLIAQRTVRVHMAFAAILFPGLAFELSRLTSDALPVSAPSLVGVIGIALLVAFLLTRRLFRQSITNDQRRRRLASVTIVSALVIALGVSYPKVIEYSPTTEELKRFETAVSRPGRDLDCWIVGDPLPPSDLVLAAAVTRDDARVGVVRSISEIQSLARDEFLVVRHGTRTRRPVLLGGYMMRTESVGRPLFSRSSEIHIDLHRAEEPIKPPEQTTPVPERDVAAS